MKVVLIRGSGFVGNAILQELLQRGHEVTSIVRNAQKITPTENLTVVSANVLDGLTRIFTMNM